MPALLPLLLYFVGLVPSQATPHGLSSHEQVFQQPERLVVSPSLSSCCAFLSSPPPALLSCLNNSAVQNHQRVQDSVPYMQSPTKQGPSLNIAIVTRATPEVYPYASVSFLIQSVYAEHNGYYMLPLFPDSSVSDYERYRKLVPLLDTMNRHASEADYIVWVDADLVILDLDMRIEQIAAEYPKSHIILSADVSSLVNSGFIIVRNTPFGKRILQKWLSIHDDIASFTDQVGFEKMYNAQLSEKEKEKISIIRPDALNSEAPAMSRQVSYNQVLHLAAEGLSMRRNSFIVGAEEVCNALHENRAPSHQIKLTRQALLSVAETSYRSDKDVVVDDIKNLHYAGRNESYYLDMVHHLRQAVSKYVYTIQLNNGEKVTLEALEATREAINIVTGIVNDVENAVLKNLGVLHQPSEPLAEIMAMRKKASKKKKLSRLSSFTLLINLVKAKCEITYDLVLFLQNGVIDGSLSEESLYEWEVQSKDVSTGLHFLQDAVSPAQQHLILDMQASFYGSTGEMLLSLGQVHKAMTLLREALDIYNRLQQDGLNGDIRSVSSITSTMAHALCKNGQHEEGLEMHQKSISDEEFAVGDLHYRIASKYIQAGLCATQAGENRVGKTFLEKAKQTMQRNSHIPYSEHDKQSLVQLMRLVDET